MYIFNNRGKMKNYITKDKLRKLAKEYKLKKPTNRLLYHYCDLGLIEKSKIKRIKGKQGGTISFWKADTPKLLFVIQNLKKLGIRLKLKGIKYYMDLLRLDEKAISEIKKIKIEKKYLEKYLYSRGISSKQIVRLKKIYPVLFCEVFLSRYDIFEEALTFRSEIEILDLTEKLLKEAKTKEQRLILKSILDNPAIETNIVEVEDIKEAYILAMYDEPFDLKVVYKTNLIEII